MKTILLTTLGYHTSQGFVNYDKPVKSLVVISNSMWAVPGNNCTIIYYDSSEKGYIKVKETPEEIKALIDKEP